MADPKDNQTLNISLPASGNPATLDCTQTDKVNWTNNTGYSISSFTLPTCVSPNSISVPIANGATTRDFSISSGSKGNYNYSYAVDSPPGDTRGGTIDVTG